MNPHMRLTRPRLLIAGVLAAVAAALPLAAAAQAEPAELYRGSGQLFATHFAGPTWLAVDGSKAVGSVVRPAPVDPTAIPWLLLSASGSSGPDGDRLERTTLIQQIATTGGLMPPANACNVSTASTEVPYTAVNDGSGADGETRTRTGDTTIFSRGPRCRWNSRKACN